MRERYLAAFLGALVVTVATVSVSSVTVAGQAPAAAKAKPAAVKGYVAPRTKDGQPDLQGVWANNDATPLQRPAALAGRQFLTDNEVAALRKRASELFNGESDAAFGDQVFLTVLEDAKNFKTSDAKTGNYNHFWIVDREFDNRTSLVTDPADGRIPTLTANAAKWQTADAAYRQAHPADGPEDLPLSHRCVTFGVPRLGAGYNSYFQIIQGKDSVAIVQEMIHDVRIIPLDGRPHVPSDVKLWHGDSRGRWEGETLVVETTNFSDKARFERMPAANLNVVERFTRIGPQTVQWEVTATDPTTWTRPWTASLLLRSTSDQLYEMACHEGNEGLAGALSGHRAIERREAEASKKGSN